MLPARVAMSSGVLSHGVSRLSSHGLNTSWWGLLCCFGIYDDLNIFKQFQTQQWQAAGRRLNQLENFQDCFGQPWSAHIPRLR